MHQPETWGYAQFENRNGGRPGWGWGGPTRCSRRSACAGPGPAPRQEAPRPRGALPDAPCPWPLPLPPCAPPPAPRSQRRRLGRRHRLSPTPRGPRVPTSWSCTLRSTRTGARTARSRAPWPSSAWGRPPTRPPSPTCGCKRQTCGGGRGGGGGQISPPAAPAGLWDGPRGLVGFVFPASAWATLTRAARVESPQGCRGCPPPLPLRRCHSWHRRRCPSLPRPAASPGRAPRRAPSAAAGRRRTGRRGSTSRQRGGWTWYGRAATARSATGLPRAAAGGADESGASGARRPCVPAAAGSAMPRSRLQNSILSSKNLVTLPLVNGLVKIGWLSRRTEESKGIFKRPGRGASAPRRAGRGRPQAASAGGDSSVDSRGHQTQQHAHRAARVRVGHPCAASGRLNGATTQALCNGAHGDTRVGDAKRGVGGGWLGPEGAGVGSRQRKGGGPAARRDWGVGQGGRGRASPEGGLSGDRQAARQVRVTARCASNVNTRARVLLRRAGRGGGHMDAPPPRPLAAGAQACGRPAAAQAMRRRRK
jgi:hypothetical protein